MLKKEPAKKIVRRLRNGRITIPAAFRQELGIHEHPFLQMTLVDGELRISPIPAAARTKGSPWLKELYELFAPSREIASQYSEEEINADIDQAIAEVRGRRNRIRVGSNSEVPI